MHKAGIQRSKKDLIDSFVSMKESPWNFSMAILRFLRTFIVQTSFADSAPRLKCGRSFCPLLMPLEGSRHADIFIPRTTLYFGRGLFPIH